MEESKIITAQNDIFFYFEMLKNQHPQSILDVGMFLKRTGCVSRQAMSYEIPAETVFHGVDLFPEYQMRVYEKVYDRCNTLKEFLKHCGKNPQEDSGIAYDLAVMLRVGTFLTEQEDEQIWGYLLKYAKQIITDQDQAQREIQAGRICGYYDVTVENDHYALVDCGQCASREG